MPQRTSGKAIAALVLGIVSMCVPYVGIVTGVIAIVFGVLGMKEVDRDPQTVKGKGMAITGLVLGAVALVLYIIVIIFFGALIASFGPCIQDSNSQACQDLQNQVTLDAPLAFAQPLWNMPSWPAAAWPAWASAS
jgi:hypothetical protein